MAHYQRPDWFNINILNPTVAALTRAGISVLEVGSFFGGVGADSSDEELGRIASDHPVFRIEPFL